MVTLQCVRGPIVVAYKFMQTDEEREVNDATAAEAKAQYGDAVLLLGETHHFTADQEITSEVTVLETNPSGATVNTAEVKAESDEVPDGTSLRNVEEPATKRGIRTQRNAKR